MKTLAQEIAQRFPVSTPVIEIADICEQLSGQALLFPQGIMRYHFSDGSGIVVIDEHIWAVGETCRDGEETCDVEQI